MLEVESGYKEATEPPSTRVYDKDMPRFRYGGSAVLNRPMFENGGIHEGGGKVSGPGGEKDDMINAKLSNNEFVMTADAVRGAGNGDINKGANKMYQLMNNFERMA